MLAKLGGGAVAIVLAAATPSAWAEDGAPTQTASWRLQADQASCTLASPYSASGSNLFIQAVPGTDYFRLVLSIRNPSAIKPFEFSPVTITFDNSEAHLDGTASSMKVSLSEGPAMVIRLDGLDSKLIETLARSSSLTLTRKGEVIGPFHYGPAIKAVAALDGCISDQLIAWGADPARFQPGGHKPVALKQRDDWLTNDRLLSLSRFISSPSAILNTVFRVAVSGDGHIVGCAHAVQDGDDKMEKEVCAALLDKHLFEPALDPGGKSVRGAASFEIRLASRPG